MMGVLTSDLFIQLTTTLAHLSNMTLNTSEMSLGGEIDNETLAGRKQWQNIALHKVAQLSFLVLPWFSVIYIWQKNIWLWDKN